MPPAPSHLALALVRAALGALVTPTHPSLRSPTPGPTISQGNEDTVIFTLAPRFSAIRTRARAERVRPAAFAYLCTVGKFAPSGPGRWPSRCVGAGGRAGRLSLAVDGDFRTLAWRGCGDAGYDPHELQI